MTGGAGSSAGQDSLLWALPQTSEAEITPLLSETAKTKLNLHAATAGLQAQVGDLLTPPTQKKKKKKVPTRASRLLPPQWSRSKGGSSRGNSIPQPCPSRARQPPVPPHKPGRGRPEPAAPPPAAPRPPQRRAEGGSRAPPQPRTCRPPRGAPWRRRPRLQPLWYEREAGAEGGRCW